MYIHENFWQENEVHTHTYWYCQLPGCYCTPCLRLSKISALYELLRSANISLHTSGMNLCGPLSAWFPTRAACHHLSLLPSRMWRYHRVWRWGLQRCGCLQWSCSQRELCVCLCVGVCVCGRGGGYVCVCVDGRHIIYSTWTCSRKSLIRTRGDKRDERCSDSWNDRISETTDCKVDYCTAKYYFGVSDKWPSTVLSSPHDVPSLSLPKFPRTTFTLLLLPTHIPNTFSSSLCHTHY